MSVQQAEGLRKRKGLVETNLEKIRVKRNLSQNELSIISGIPLATIRLYEQRRRKVENAKLSFLLDLCLALKCQLEDLLEDETIIEQFRKTLENVEPFVCEENDVNGKPLDEIKEIYLYFFHNEDNKDLTDDQKDGIRFVLLDFPQTWKNVLELRYRNGCSLKSISESSQISVERVRQIIWQAYNKLKRLKESEYVIYGFQTWHKMSIQQEVDRDMSQVSISEMKISGRAYNCLMRAGITTIGEAKQLTREELLKMKNMGEKATNEILFELQKYD